MAIKDALLPEYDHEMGVTRRVLARVPLADAAWQPHARSMSLHDLARHVAEIPGWARGLLEAGSFDVDAARAPTTVYDGIAELLADFDVNVSTARAAIESRTDAELMEPWTLRKGGEVLLTVPKVAVLRSFLINHLIHHRGQLSVYMRMRNVPVPAIYGPSADEAPF